ncbi:MAG TPA: PHP domain-containing protein, partial [Azospirillaceae bacterium]|nr:PHP domain-containing protein [Azospirillaceae bacterium]
MTMYCELQAMTNYSFLEGASHADELALTAANLGLAGLAVTDRNTLAGVVQAHLAAKRRGLPFIVACRLDLTDGQSLLAYVPDRQAYARLSRLLTLGKRRAPKGKCFLDAADVLAAAEGLIFAQVAPPGPPDDGLAAQTRFWRDR